MKISIISKNINPTSPQYLSGQINRIAKHTEILDDLLCSALIIDQEQTKLCLISFDLLQFDATLSNRIRHEVAKNLKIPFDNVFTIPSHTHAAPEILKDGLFGIKTESDVTDEYLDQVVNTSLDVAIDANKQLQSVSVEYVEQQIEGYYGNRNVKHRLSDKSLRFLTFKQGDKLIGLLVNIACHPTILGPQNTRISADLIGALRRGIEEKYNCPVFICNGAEGDMSNRHYRLSNDEVELERTSKGILNQLPLILNAQRLDIDKITNYAMTFRFKCINDERRIQNAIDENKKRILNNHNEDSLKLLHATNTVLTHRLNQTMEPELRMEYSIIDFKSLIIVSLPLELFSSLYLKLKESIDLPIIVLGLTNTSLGYCVDQASYDTTYEGLTSPFIKGEGERFIDALIDEIEQIRRK